ncbi:hypothetical protein RvY_15975 [Ramazzottius varieornatus]|uniref:nicotinamidase n=1 Tax=Ramazzottius varieornatus TaxID=947166 RepID=A0A1D1W4N6_RAMVA|nr:hypothetical protein RvY_15975 [Ramazzottius varieornatus]
MKDDNRDKVLREWAEVSEGSAGTSEEKFRIFCGKTFGMDSTSLAELTPTLDQAFSTFDADRDGHLNTAEFQTCWTSWIEPVLFPRNALLVIDIQNDFITGSLALKNAPAKQDGAEVVPIANQLIGLGQFQDVVYSQDWHPSDHCSFIEKISEQELDSSTEITADKAKVFDTVVLAGSPPVKQQLFPSHAVRNTSGADFHEDLKVPPNSKIIKKGTHKHADCMSVFADYRGRPTELDVWLTARNITDVFLCGLAMDYCVGLTALDALDLGYRTWVVEDGTRGCFEDQIEDLKNRIRKKGGIFVKSHEVENILGGTNRNLEKVKAGLSSSALRRHGAKDEAGNA